MKPQPAALKLVRGNPGKRPLGEDVSIDMRDGDLEPPKKLTAAQRRLWDRYINTAWWLTDHDTPKAFMWVCLSAEFEKAPADMVASRISNLRALGSELGLDPSARARMGGDGRKKNSDPAEEFF